jgi:hypothetical protein
MVLIANQGVYLGRMVLDCPAVRVEHVSSQFIANGISNDDHNVKKLRCVTAEECVYFHNFHVEIVHER